MVKRYIYYLLLKYLQAESGGWLAWELKLELSPKEKERIWVNMRLRVQLHCKNTQHHIELKTSV